MHNKKNSLSLAIATGLLMMAQAHAGDIENTLSATGDNMTIKQGANELMRVQGDGNIGIGTATPGKKLVLQSDSGGGNSTLDLIAYSSEPGSIFFKTAGGTAAAPSKTLAGEKVGNIGFVGHTGAGFFPIGNIQALAETDMSVERSGAMTFSTTKNAAIAEKMRITSDGKVGIGTTAPTSLFHVGANKAYIKIDHQQTDPSGPFCAGDVNVNALEVSKLDPTEAYGYQCWDRDLNHPTRKYNLYEVANRSFTLNYTAAVQPAVAQCSFDSDPNAYEAAVSIPTVAEADANFSCWDKAGSNYYQHTAEYISGRKGFHVLSNGIVNINEGQTGREIKPTADVNIGGSLALQSYSPLLYLQRDTNTGGFIQGIQSLLQDGTHNWFMGNGGESSFLISKGNYTNSLLTVRDTGVVAIKGLAGGNGSEFLCVDASGNIFRKVTACNL